MEKAGYVAPLVGAWIEIKVSTRSLSFTAVAPLVGAWIEIHRSQIVEICIYMSLPLWERGLKLLR